jgi:integrase
MGLLSESHKLSWRGKLRKILLGPKSQAMLRPFLEGRDPESFVFSPKESKEALQAERAAKRKSKRQPSQVRRKKKPNPKRRPREYYSAHAYSRAVARTCEKAGIPIWRPNRLRHTAATIIRREYGLEAAQVILGHTRCDTTQIYAERDTQKAEAIIKEIG